MRVLLDENIDKSLKALFDKKLEVVTVPEKGWSGTKNGKLLALAADEFDIFVTMDKNLQHQQNLGNIDLAVIVIRAYSNAFGVVSKLMPSVNEAVRNAKIGLAIHVTT